MLTKLKMSTASLLDNVVYVEISRPLYHITYKQAIAKVALPWISSYAAQSLCYPSVGVFAGPVYQQTRVAKEGIILALHNMNLTRETWATYVN